MKSKYHDTIICHEDKTKADADIFKLIKTRTQNLFDVSSLFFEKVEYSNEGQCNEIKISALIHHYLSCIQNKIC